MFNSSDNKTCIPQANLYVDPREKVTARYQVLSVFYLLIVSLRYRVWLNLPILFTVLSSSVHQRERS